MGPVAASMDHTHDSWMLAPLHRRARGSTGRLYDFPKAPRQGEVGPIETGCFQLRSVLLSAAHTPLPLNIYKVKNSVTPLRGHNHPKCQQEQDWTSEACDFANSCSCALIAAAWFSAPDEKQHRVFPRAVTAQCFLQTTKGNWKPMGERAHGKRGQEIFSCSVVTDSGRG